MSIQFEDKVVTGNKVRCGNRSRDGRDPPPFPVAEYIELYGYRLDGQRFSAMHLAGDVR